jgi:type II secretory pathway pseudopilin PulG
MVRTGEAVRWRERIPGHECGFSLIELLFAVVLGTVLMTSILSLANQGTRRIRQVTAGKQLQLIGHAVRHYVMSHYASLLAGSTATRAVPIPMADLVAGGYLPPGYTGQNPFGDVYTVYVLQPKTNDLAAVTLGAPPDGSPGFTWTDQPADNHYADVVIPGAAQTGGPEAGYVATGDVPGEVRGGLVGAYGGWTFSIAGTSIPNPGPGHLVLFQYFSNGTLDPDYLYRVAVPGHPELNQMFTALNMGGNDVTGVDDLSASGNVATSGLSPTTGFPHGVAPNGIQTWDLFAAGGLYAGVDASGNPAVAIAGGNVSAEGDVTAENGRIALSHAVVFETEAQNGSEIPKPLYCPPGSAPRIFITPVFISAGPNALPLAGYQAWATPAGSGWIVQARVLTQTGWVSPPAPYLVVKAVTQCD